MDLHGELLRCGLLRLPVLDELLDHFTCDRPNLARDDLRGVLASRAASRVAAMPGVRKTLLAFQQDFAWREGGAVLDGRDIGTVICPDADVKLYVTATVGDNRVLDLERGDFTILDMDRLSLCNPAAVADRERLL